MSNDANAQKRKEQIKKRLVYSGMVLLCLLSFYFIFKPSKEQVQAEQPADICRPGGTLGEVIRACSEVYARRYCYNLRGRSRGGGDHHTKRQGEAPKQTARNTIKACVHGDQTIISGQSVRLRLLEDMRVGKYVLPRNTLITGEGSIKGERLDIEILQAEYNGTIIPVELTVHDNDGQAGIFIPGSMEVSAAKEMAANLGQNLGTSISITNQSTGDQLLSEVGRGAIQGVSQYISKKMREEKVHLKSGFTMRLYQNNQ